MVRNNDNVIKVGDTTYITATIPIEDNEAIIRDWQRMVKSFMFDHQIGDFAIIPADDVPDASMTRGM